MDHIIPKKRLGQHFLKDDNIAAKIVDSLGESNSNILEIGPGEGILTKHLLQKKGIHLNLVEVDREAVELLKNKYPDLRNNIIKGDFLKIDLSSYFDQPFAVIGNFPYNISSQILFRILANRSLIPEVVCMLQKEVAERISSPPGNKQYGILSVLLQAFYDIKLLFTVSEKVFFPPPKVLSAVISLNRNSRNSLDCDESLFFKVVKTAFNQRRKTMRNSLSPLVKDKSELSDTIFNKRPEQLSVNDFVFVSKLIKAIA